MDSQLELEFRTLKDHIGAEIDVHLTNARRLLDEAVALSEKHGIPFRAEVSPLSQTYVPEAFRERFAKMDMDRVEEIMDVSIDPGQYGWERSAVC